MIVFNLITGNQYVQKPRECEKERDVLKDLGFFPDLLYMSRTQYTRTGNWHTGKWKFWKYVVEAELSKLTYVEDIYWKFIRIYEHQQETKVPFYLFSALLAEYSHPKKMIKLQFYFT